MNLYTDSDTCFVKAKKKYANFLSLLVLVLLLMPAMAYAEPAHYRITGNGGWGHFKLGHSTETLWRPKVYPAVGQSQLELTLNGNGSTDWNLIAVRGRKNEVVLGDYIAGNPQGFFTVVIPLSAFESGSFERVANFSIPYAIGPEQIDISVARVAFTGGSDPYIWFDQKENRFDSKWPAPPTHPAALKRITRMKTSQLTVIRKQRRHYPRRTMKLPVTVAGIISNWVITRITSGHQKSRQHKVNRFYA